MIKVIMTSVAILMCLTTNASSLVFDFNGNKINFFKDKKLRVTISEDCKNLNCEAISKLRSVSPKKLNIITKYAHDMGAIYCREVFKESVLNGTDLKGNKNSFCFFSDGSYLDTGTIHYYYDNPEELKNI